METATRVKFPSADWFRAIQARMNAQEAKYRDLGYADSRGVFHVAAGGPLPADRYFGLTFEVYGCVDVRELSEAELESFDPDWIFRGSYPDWREMIANIRAHGRADADHTLNRLSLLKHPFRVHGADPMRVDLFHRQQASFQEFIDESASVDTEFKD
jgi:hypothetical protein